MRPPARGVGRLVALHQGGAHFELLGDARRLQLREDVLVDARLADEQLRGGGGAAAGGSGGRWRRAAVAAAAGEPQTQATAPPPTPQPAALVRRPTWKSAGRPSALAHASSFFSSGTTTATRALSKLLPYTHT